MIKLKLPKLEQLNSYCFQCFLNRVYFSTGSHKIRNSSKTRYNPVKIQLLSNSLHKQIFKKKTASSEDLSYVREHLQEHNLWDKPTTTLPEVDFQLPKIEGNIDEHFRTIALQQTESYRKDADLLSRCELPIKPNEWFFCEGWTRYNKDGSFERVSYPSEHGVVFDIEVLMTEDDGKIPTMATAASKDAWYSWCSRRLTDRHFHWDHQPTLLDLIPLEKPELLEERLVIGHNVGFDRSFVKEQYYIRGTSLRFVDTMSLHIAIAGFTSHQRILASAKKADEKKASSPYDKTKQKRKELREMEQRFGTSGFADFPWLKTGSLNNLNDVYQHHCKEPPLNKELRDVFIKGTMTDVLDNFQTLMTYCADDVIATHKVFKVLWPEFELRFPHPVTFAGMLEMGSAYLPVNKNWHKYIDRCSDVYDDLQRELRLHLTRLANQACELQHNLQYTKDPWLWSLDWSKNSFKLISSARKNEKIPEHLDDVDPIQYENGAMLLWPRIPDEDDVPLSETVKSVLATSNRIPKKMPHMAGYPKWYRDLCPRATEIEKAIVDDDFMPGPSKITIQQQIAPLLLQLTWDGFPLYHDAKLGWGYLVWGEVNLDRELQEQYQNFPVREIKELTVNAVNSAHDSTSPSSLTESDIYKQIRSLDQQIDQEEEESYEFFKLIQDRRNLLARLEADGDNEELNKINKLERDIEEIDWAGGDSSSLYEEKLKLEKKYKVLEKKKNKKLKASRLCGLTYHRGIGPYDNVKLPSCYFFKMPHKDGHENNVGSPLAKDFLSKVEAGVLRAKGGTLAETVLTLNYTGSYWKNNEKRIRSQMVVSFRPDDLPETITRDSEYDKDDFYGTILPRIVSAGTVTRRAVEPTWLTASNAYPNRLASELKAMIQTPPGYHFVGADVDSQELWIAAILGDAHFAGIHGGTAFGWMTLQGKKSDATDLHSKTAELAGIDRDQAKVFNYGRIYGAGVKFAVKLLLQWNHKLLPADATQRAKKMYAATKGHKVSTSHDCENFDEEEVNNLLDIQDIQEHFVLDKIWTGGSESAMFNVLEMIAKSKSPSTPVLNCRMSKSLEPGALHPYATSGKDLSESFLTSRINWVVQSSAVDYLHLMLVCMRWLLKQYQIEGRFSISIHDEVRYLVKSEDRYRAALALQITNLLTRSMFAYKLKMYDLPQSVAFFSAVDIDRCMRKEVTMDCVTPSNPQGLEKTYGIPQGEALDIYSILKKTNASLHAADQAK